MRKLLALACLTALYSCGGPTEADLTALAPTETFQDDTFLSAATQKRALIVTAHDDDLVGMSGTIAKLQQNGWDIKQITFTSESPERDTALVQAAQLIMDDVEFIWKAHDQRRSDFSQTEAPYMPIAKAEIDKVFNKAELAQLLTQKINDYNPTVIFTMDSEIGGYGHPEHVLISQLVADLFNSGTIKAGHIYQTVYPDSMEDKILKERLTKQLEEWGYPNPYMLALEAYNSDGMPEPTTQVNIQEQANTKMEFIRSFREEELNAIGKFIPMFQDFDAETYFKVFDREFFRVITKE
ncbi:PIG-L family deacetylase [Pontibacter sp. Tf4]|uniref:PIG-L family deacetylase n=1 Tax=Pontibacter sp. Tf4 TaxID=2761620 RepID=UPI0016259847|nr:PIG-L family deacetylase [Pontibacter sp. Tf4]MBB6609881.1 PIG-L family deacetylase [Pontibacter sp. Tf4]